VITAPFFYGSQDCTMPSLEDVSRIVLFSGILLLSLFCVEFARKRLGFPTEVGRKILHIGTGVCILFAPTLFPQTFSVAFIAAIFVFLNIVAYSKGWLRSVHQTDRPSFGTVYYPASFLVLVLPLWENSSEIVVASMFVLALGDGMAAIVGESIKKPHLYSVSRDKKSWEGTITMVVASIAAILIVREFSNAFSAHTVIGTASLPKTGLFLLAFGLFVAGWEAASPRGLDNVSVPLMGALVLVVCIRDASGFYLEQFTIGVGLAVVISTWSYRVQFLQLSGAFATFLLAANVYGFGGWQWTAPILAFFLLSSLLSKAGAGVKTPYESNYEKSSTRDAGQVFANGGVAGAIVLLSVLIQDERWFLAYLGSIAAVTADTWATEIGAFSRKAPRSIVTLRRTERGQSGAVSVLGTFGSLLGAMVISGIGLSVVWPVTNASKSFLIPVFAGTFGSLLDSLLGATLQAQYSCGICGKHTERTVHCGRIGDHIRGYAWMGNDVVNTVCAISGAVLGFCLASIAW
jgi:uncharacterized protein (TIGR00297 family)